MKYGALEAGGTKMVCALVDEDGNISERTSFPTKTPEETIPDLIDYFKDKDIAALGIGCFGPISPNKKAEDYGHITTTPKPGWSGYDIVGAFEEALGVPVGFDTDVNGSMLGEATWGAAKDVDNAVYITVGTGIGAGIMIDRKLLHGMLHPEAGHIPMIVREDDTYAGKCPYHGTCLEGMAAGPAIEDRWGARAETLVDRDEVWDLEAYYLAQAMMNYILTLSPERIILGGGVMHVEKLMPMIREKTKEMLNGYVQTKQMDDLEHYIVRPALGDDQGILGAAKLGMQALEESQA